MELIRGTRKKNKRNKGTEIILNKKKEKEREWEKS